MLPEQSPVSIPQSRGIKPNIPDYELVRLIGRGSYGDVWLAQGITNVYRAVKVVWRDRFSDPEPFEREFKGLKGFAAVSLSESRHLALLHVGRNEPAGFFYYVMELADDYESGKIIDPDSYVPYTFKEMRSRRGRIGAPETIELAVELTRGLQALHEKHLIHRDIKPSNVIMVGGVPKLADIGLVTFDSEASTFVGTEGFVPPEGPGTPQADIYSLGKLLYEMVTGLDRKDYPRLPPGLHEFSDRKSLLELNEILLRACDTDIARRYGSAAELLDDIFLLQAGRSIRRMRMTEKSLRRALTWVTALAIAAAVAGVGAFIERQRAAEETARRRQAEAERDLTAQKLAYGGGMARAQRAIEMNDPGRARRYLKEVASPADSAALRGLEWSALWNSSAGDPSDVFHGVGQHVWRAFVSPDGKWVAACVEGNEVLVWDAVSLELKRRIPGITRLEGFSRDGKWMLGFGPTQRLTRWDSATGQPNGEAPAALNRPIAPYGSGSEIGYNTSRNRYEVYDFDQGRVTHSAAIEPLEGGLNGFMYHSEASHGGHFVVCEILASSAEQRPWKMELLNLDTGEVVWRKPIHNVITGIAASADGQFVAYATPFNGHVSVVEIADDRVVWDARLGTEDIDYLAFSPDGKKLAGGGKDSVVWTVDAATGLNQVEYRGHSGGLEDLSWSEDSQTLYSGGAEGDVRRWKALSRPTTVFDDFLPNSGEPLQCVSDDGRYFAATMPDDSIGIVDTRSRAGRIVLKGPTIPLGFVGSPLELVTLNAKGVLQRWPLVPDSQPHGEIKFAIGRKAVIYGALSPDHRLVAAVGHAYATEVRELSTGRTLFNVPTGNSRWILFTPDSARLIDSTPGTQVRCQDVSTGTVIATHEVPYRSIAGAVSPDGKWVACGLNINEIQILSIPDLRLIRVLKTDTGRVNSLAVSPDGRRLLFGGPLGSIHVYDTSDWRELVVLSEREHPSTRGYDGLELLSISANGETLIGYRADGFVRAWDCRPNQN